MLKTVDQKVATVIDRNTFYFFDQEFEESYEAHISSLRETLLVVKNKVETEGLKKEVFEWLLAEKENGLRALLALTGFSNEYLKRLTTLIRIVDDEELSKLVFKEGWCIDTDVSNISEWGDNTIQSLLRKNPYFRKGIVNIFFEGGSIPFLAETMPLFELKKLSISKLQFEVPEMIDTLIRYKEKGSYSGMKSNNPESLICKLLDRMGLTFETGDLTELIENVPDNKRTMDFIIPGKADPRVVIESSYLVTTSSGQGDKSKTELSIDALLKTHYPHARFIGFVDGIGWYVRKGDLRRMVTAYEDVFTFHKDELIRFEQLLVEALSE